MAKELKLQVVLGALDKVSGPLRQIRDGAGTAGRELKGLRDRLKGLEESQKGIGEFRQLSRGLATTRTALSQAQGRVKALAQEMQATGTPTAAMRREFNAAVRAAQSLSRQHDQQRTKLQEVRTALSGAGISTRNLGQSERALRADIAQTNRQIDSQRERLSRLAEQTRKVAAAKEKMERTQAVAGRMAVTGAASGAMGYGILRGGGNLLGEGKDFDTTMSKVQALTRLDGASAELAALREQARDLGATTMFSAGEAASGQAFLAMAGFNPQAIRDAMPGMLDLAKAGDTDLAQTADIASNILTGFGLKTSEMGRVGDVLTASMTRSNVSLQMLGETMKYVGPNASSYGQDIEIMAAAAGKLGDAGIQGGMGGTALRAILSRLAAPPKAAAEALDELGISATDARGNMRQLPDLLTEIYEKTSKMGNAQRGGLLKAIAGEEAGSAMTVLVDQAGSGSLQEFIATLREARGEASRTAKVMGDNWTGDLDELSSSWSDIKITLMEVTRGPLRELTQRMTEILTKVGEWAKRNPELVATLAKLAAIVGVVAAAFGGVTMALAAVLAPLAVVRFAATVLGLRISSVFGLLRTALPAVLTVVRSIGLALMANPVAAAIAGIAVAALLIYQYWEPIKAWFTDLWSQVRSAFDGGIGAVTQLLINWSPMGLIYKAISSGLAQLGIELPGKFTEFGAMLMQGMVNGIRSMAGAVKDSIVDMGDSAMGWFKEKLGIHSPSRVFMGYGENISEGAGIGIERGSGHALAALRNLTAAVAATGVMAPGAMAMPDMSGLANFVGQELRIDTRPAISSAPAPAASIGGDTIQIHIHSAPGMDPQAIARAVRDELERRDRDRDARQRSSMTDYGY